MVTLKTGNSVLNIDEFGAEMKSFLYNGVEYLWVGNPAIWARSTPNLFPVTGALKDDKYILDGVEYSMPKHGFAKDKTFEVESATDTTAVFLLRSDDSTKAGFPYEFEFRICYTLTDSKISIDYKVTNLSEKTMWFSVGSHDGFATPEGVQDYDLIFSENETLSTYPVVGVLLGYDTTPIINGSNKFTLSYDICKYDSLVFKDMKSDSCRLVNRNTGRGIQLDYPECNRFVIWTIPDAPYVCLEPWFGQPDNIDSDYDITHKEAILSLEAGKTFVSTRVITALDGK